MLTPLEVGVLASLIAGVVLELFRVANSPEWKLKHRLALSIALGCALCVGWWLLRSSLEGQAVRVVYEEAEMALAEDLSGAMELYLPDAVVKSESREWVGFSSIKARYEQLFATSEFISLEHRIEAVRWVSPHRALVVSSTSFDQKVEIRNGAGELEGHKTVRLDHADNRFGQRWVLARVGGQWRIAQLRLSTGDPRRATDQDEGAD